MRGKGTQGPGHTVVAVARNFAVLLHRIWADHTEFRPAKMEDLTHPKPNLNEVALTG